ncbi:MAG: hypothetical protein M2R45_04452 [Verrucomicrobia subdivision 3 bacterium]|nr:hypothetical protein [Limisphaerales bacterium]MCS1415017.1 hypothetical protein [Limisphaerales bacterium]
MEAEHQARQVETEFEDSEWWAAKLEWIERTASTLHISLDPNDTTWLEPDVAYHTSLRHSVIAMNRRMEE